MGGIAAVRQALIDGGPGLPPIMSLQILDILQKEILGLLLPQNATDIPKERSPRILKPQLFPRMREGLTGKSAT